MRHIFTAMPRSGFYWKLKCETDFVARNSEFKELAHDIAMHIAGMDSKDAESFLEEPFVKDPAITVKDLIERKSENWEKILRSAEFVRFEL